MRHSNLLALAATLAAMAMACAPGRTQYSGPISAVAAAAPASGTELGRAELWAAHCSRCHTLRPRTEYSPAQWAVIVNHMRTVADLPGEDYRRLLEFLAGRPPAPTHTGRRLVAGRGARTTQSSAP